MTIYALAAAFLVTALLYASVGFGGGSTYSALLALSGVDYRLLPIVSLGCNIAVVTGGTWRFAKAGLMPWKGAGILTSIAAPAALLGGLTPVSERAFFLLLGASLLLTGFAMFLPQRNTGRPTDTSRWIPLAVAPLGYLAGLVGIGGGIFLAPLLHLARWNEARSIAATASLFILVNSMFGLAGQFLKNGFSQIVEAASWAWPLLVAVVIGGQVGSFLAVGALPLNAIRYATAALTIFVGARLLVNF